MAVQIVEVAVPSGSKYAYGWKGEPLEVGDWVTVPSNWYVQNPQVLQVVSTESSYVGPVKMLLSKMSCTCEDPSQPLCYYHPTSGAL